MDEISNKTLATLLVVAIVISLAGTFFAMRGVTTVTNYVTGAQTGLNTQTGSAKVNITDVTSIFLNQPTVNFGEGYRNESVLGAASVECNLSSYGPPSAAPACWHESATGTPYAPQDFVLENDGNRYVSLKINSTAQANYYDSCVNGLTAVTAGDVLYSWTSRETETGSCSVHATLNTTWNAFDNTEQDLCTNLSFGDSADEINISINLSVPSGPTGECSNSVDFSATALS